MGRVRGVRHLIRQTARAGGLLLAGLMLVAVLLPTATPVLAQCGRFTFGPPTSFSTGGEQPFRVLAQDLNGDGLPDLTVVNLTSHDVSVLISRPDGTFQPPSLFPTGGVASSFEASLYLATADLNDDGNPDLITTNPHSDDGAWDVSVLLGKTDGTFRAPIFLSTGNGLTSSVVAGFFDGDTNLDLAVAHGGPDFVDRYIAVLLGNGDGTFDPAVFFDVGGASPFVLSIVAADFDNDTELDLAVTRGEGA